jgi:hypothetical protein
MTSLLSNGYTPPQHEIEFLATELELDALTHADLFFDYLARCEDSLKTFMVACYMNVAHDDLKALQDVFIKKLRKEVNHNKDFLALAEEQLVAEVGYWVQTAVDDDKFIVYRG